MRRWQLLGVWVVAVVAATVLTWQIVSMANDRVGEASTDPIQVTTPDSSTSTTGGSTSTTTVSSTPTTAPNGTSSSSSSPATPTSQAPPSPEVRTIPTEGGTLTVSVTPGSITYLSAVPATGFAVELDEAGPPEVRVEFISVDTEVEIRVRWRDGQVVVETDVDREN